MNDWERFIEALLTEDFFSNLNMKDIIDSDSTRTRRVFKVFEINNLDECHCFYIRSDTFVAS